MLKAVGFGVAVGLALGLLVAVTWTMLLPPEETPELQEARQLIEFAQMRIADESDFGGIPDALQSSRRALELDPGNEDANAVIASARGNALTLVRDELTGGRPSRARHLLDIFDDQWPEDKELLVLRTEIQEMFDELDRSAELANLLDGAQADIAEKRLREPKQNNAWEKLARAEMLIASSDYGRRDWIQASRQQIADEYVQLVTSALSQRALGKARRYLTSLEASAPSHSELSRLSRDVGKLAEPPDQKIATEQELIEPPLASADHRSPVAPHRRANGLTPQTEALPGAPGSAAPALLDAEDEFWANVKRQYEENPDCSVLQRYNERYPGGRFKEEYIALKAECSRHDNL